MPSFMKFGYDLQGAWYTIGVQCKLTFTESTRTFKWL